MNRSIIAILHTPYTKLFLENSVEWYKHVDRVQQFINASFNRSIGTTLFRLLIEQNMRLRNVLQIRDTLQKLAVDVPRKAELQHEAKKAY